MAKTVKTEENKADVKLVGGEIQESNEQLSKDSVDAIGQVPLPGSGAGKGKGTGTVVKK